MSDFGIYPNDGDTITEARETRSRARGNSSDYVERGLTVTLNGDGTVDVGSGFAIVRDNDQAWEIEDATGATGVSLATMSGTNYIYLTFHPAASDPEASAGYHVDTDQSPPSTPSLLIAEANESSSSVTERNRDPSLSADGVFLEDSSGTFNPATMILTSEGDYYDLSGQTDTERGQTLQTAIDGVGEKSWVYAPPGIYIGPITVSNTNFGLFSHSDRGARIAGGVQGHGLIVDFGGSGDNDGYQTWFENLGFSTASGQGNPYDAIHMRGEGGVSKMHNVHVFDADRDALHIDSGFGIYISNLTTSNADDIDRNDVYSDGDNVWITTAGGDNADYEFGSNSQSNQVWTALGYNSVTNSGDSENRVVPIGDFIGVDSSGSWRVDIGPKGHITNLSDGDNLGVVADVFNLVLDSQNEIVHQQQLRHLSNDGRVYEFGFHDEMRMRSSPPVIEGSQAAYVDDGTNTGDGNPGWAFTTDGGSSWTYTN